MPDYDVVIIGAGNGGLSSAATLAQNGRKVLVLEKHNIPGGCGTSFVRGRFEFEVALHQLSAMGKPETPGPMRAVFKELGIEDKIEWVSLDNLYRVVLPGRLDITLPAEKQSAIETLARRFPDEEEGIRKFYDLAYSLFFEYFTVARTPDDEVTPEKFPLYFKYAFKSAQEVMDEFLKDPLLQLSLNVYWSFMGMPPERLPFSILAGNIFVYMEYKPFHLRGGSQVISNAFVDIIQRTGNDVRFNCAAEKILIEDGRTKGVITEDGEHISCDYVISNISPVHTYVNLMEEDEIPEGVLENLKNYRIGTSAFTCYVGLDCPPEELGFNESMNILYTTGDVNEAFSGTKKLLVEDDPIIASCYTVDDKHFSPEGTSFVALVSAKYADPWIELDPERYYEMKFRSANNMIDRVAEHFPGFRSHIEEIEVATPLTHMRYLDHPGGAIYGFEQDINSTGVFFPRESHVKNLVFSSGWVGICGFQPNYMLGYSTAKSINAQLAKEASPR